MSEFGAAEREPETIAARLLEAAAKAGASAADATVIAGEALEVSARAGALEQIERSESLDFGLRVLVQAPDGWREAGVRASDVAADAIEETALRAVAMAREAPVDPYGGLSDPAARVADPEAVAAGLNLAAAAAASPEELLETAIALEAAALSVEGVAQAEGAQASYGRERRLLATSDGFLGRYAATSRSISVSAVAGAGTGMERDYAYSVARGPAELRSIEAVGREAGERAVRRLSPRRAPKGAYPVLFERRVASGLVSGLLGALNGAQIARGASFLADRMGERILPAGVDLIDDPTLAGALGSRPFDGEALPGARKRLIADGAVAAWLLDCGSARKLGLVSNGAAFRGLAGGLQPGPSNAWLTAGAQTPEALRAQMGRGLLVTEMMGRGLNPVTGDYSRGASGFWVENGEIAYPVSELTVAGHMLEMARSLVAADDLRFEGRIEAPSLLVAGLTLGSA